MLLGEHEHTIDDKNRLTLPAKFRRAFLDGVVVTRGMDGCLYAYPRGQWQR
jgi:MraZ protein